MLSAHQWAMDRPTKISFAEMSAAGVRELLVYCADCKCSHSIAISGNPWPDEASLSDLDARFVWSACGKRGADARPNFKLEQSPDPHDDYQVNLASRRSKQTHIC
jgi:hypothetical protein